MVLTRIAVCALALGAPPAVAAQDAAVAAAETPAGPALPAATVVEIEIAQPLTSKTSKPGDGFDIRLAEPVLRDGAVLLPAGIVGRGEVVHAARAGWGGKAGELILAARFLLCGDVQVPLGRFRFGTAGKSRVDGAFAASMLVSFAGALIVGGEVTVPPGTRGNARIAREIALPPACAPNSKREDEQ